MMNLVTITCTRDLHLMRLQANSMDRFVAEPCTHLVVIEDSKTLMTTWEAMLRPFYTRHRLVLMQGTLSNKLDHKSGWIRQQVLKLTISAQVLSEYYLIMDSKNFFIRPVNLSQWPVSEGNDTAFDANWFMYVKWKPWMDRVQLCTGIKIPDIFWRLWPPFVLKTDIVKDILGSVDIEDLFSCDLKNQSEFILYRFFNDVTPVTGEKINHIFRSEKDAEDLSVEYMVALEKNPRLLTLGLHAKFLATGHPKIHFIKHWLISAGYDYQVVSDVFDNKCILSYN